MSITRAWPRLLVAALVAAGLALGCGSEDESGTPGPADRLGALSERQSQAAASPESAAAAREKEAADRALERKQREHRERLARKKQAQATGQSVAQQLENDRVEMPDDYPADAPRYPGAWPSQVRRLPNGVMNVMFGSEDSADEVATWLSSNLPDDGWKIVSERDMGSGRIIQGEKGSRRLNIIASSMQGSTDEVTLIAVVVTP